MNQKTTRQMLLWGGVIGGVGMALGIGYAFWNSKQMRTLRRTRRAGKLLYGLGTALHSVSNVMEETLG